VVKPMREESSSDDDAEEPEEWEGADETSCSEEEGEEVERVSNAQRGRARLHGVVSDSRRDVTDQVRACVRRNTRRSVGL
jgi:hypothetical protein